MEASLSPIIVPKVQRANRMDLLTKDHVQSVRRRMTGFFKQKRAFIHSSRREQKQ